MASKVRGAMDLKPRHQIESKEEEMLIGQHDCGTPKQSQTQVGELCTHHSLQPGSWASLGFC